MSKLIIPRLSEATYRERLSVFFNQIFIKKLTIVTAGAGYGKSTFISQVIDSQNIKNVWYNIDESDNDLSTFIKYLAIGIRKHYPTFLDNFLDQNHQLLESITNSNKEVLLNHFLIEIEEKVTKDLFIVIDNYHITQKNGEINDFVQQLLFSLTPILHLVLISRSDPGLKLSRLAAAREIVHLTEDDLAFTKTEIKNLYEQLFNISLNKTNNDLLYQKTGGWVSGLILFYHSLKNRAYSDIEQPILNFKGSHRSIYSYFKENVYDRLPDEIKQFLLRTSILNQIDVEFCNQFLKTTKSKTHLKYLEENHLFTFSVDEDRRSFYYHYLFKEFLQTKLKTELNSKERAEHSNKIALLYEKKGNDQEALKHHILAGNIEDASRLLNHLARPIIKQGRFQTVKSLLSIIPEQYIDNEPWFQYLQAGYHSLCSQVQLAFRGYKKALKCFQRQEDETGECICLMELAEYYLTIGDINRAELEYKRILKKDILDPFLKIITLGYLIRVLALARKTKEADKYARKAISVLPFLNDEKSLKICRGWIDVAKGYRYAFSGDYHKALELGERSKALFKNVGQQRLIFSSYFLISNSCFYLGHFSKGMKAAMEGINTSKEEDLFDGFTDFLRLLYAKNNLEIENIPEEQLTKSFEYCKRSLKAFEAISFIGGVAHVYFVLHKVYLRMDDISGAEQCLRKGIKTVENNDMPLIKNELKVALSQLLFFKKDKLHNEEAMVLLKDAEQNFSSSDWHMCWIARVYGRFYWEHGHRETTFNFIGYCLETSDKNNYDVWILSEREWIIPLLVEFFIMGDIKEYLKKILKKFGPGIEHQLLSLSKHKNPKIRSAVNEILSFIPKASPPDITASFFKKFNVLVGENMVKEEQWKSKKAKTLFKYLLCMRHKGYLDKEILMELLWPDEDPKKSSQRLHVALASLRKTLEPEIPKGSRSSYINRSGHAYMIDIGNNGIIDFEEFDKEVESAKNESSLSKALIHYRNAASIYEGDFLEEDLYEDWCAYEREKYKESYLFVLSKIIEYHEMQKDYEGCINAVNDYLKVDKYAENKIRLLMSCYSFTGNLAMATKIYEKSKKIIKEELCCPLSEETETLYKQLVPV